MENIDELQKVVSRLLSDPVVNKIGACLVALIIIHIVFRLIQKMVRKYATDTSNRYRFNKIVQFLKYLVIFFALGTILSDRLGSMAVAFGVAGAGIAFALQEIIASVAGWVALSLGNFYKVGDRVQLGGIRGDAIDISILRTTLMETGEWVNGDLYNGRVVKVANSFIFKEPVYNYSDGFPFLWDEVTIPIKFGADPLQVKDLLKEVLEKTVGDYTVQAAKSWKTLVQKYMIENASVAPMVTLQWDQNWLNFTLRYTVDFKKRRTSKDLIFTNVLKAIQDAQPPIEIAASSFEVTTAKSMKLTLTKESKESPSHEVPQATN